MSEKNIPLCGCQNCGVAAWMMELDKFPPLHTKIVKFHCAGCRAMMKVNIDLATMRNLSDREEVVDDSASE